MNDPWWVLESALGWKIVWCESTPRGGHKNGNWSLIADGLTWQEAVDFARRLRG